MAHWSHHCLHRLDFVSVSWLQLNSGLVQCPVSNCFASAEGAEEGRKSVTSTVDVPEWMGEGQGASWMESHTAIVATMRCRVAVAAGPS